jgi:hypothetical protein
MPEQLRRTAGAVLGTLVGSTLILAGLVMLVTPGPGLLAIAAGTAILSRHHAAVERLRGRVAERLRARWSGRPGPGPERLGPDPIGPGPA